jgi:hypothetical protein
VSSLTWKANFKVFGLSVLGEDLPRQDEKCLRKEPSSRTRQVWVEEIRECHNGPVMMMTVLWISRMLDEG